MRSKVWIALLAYEMHIRHVAEHRREDGTAMRLASVRLRVLTDLRSAIVTDIEGFVREAGARSGSALTCRNGSSAQGFVVSRMDDSLGARSLAIDLEAGTLRCRYHMCGASLDDASAQQVLAIEIGNDGTALSLWNQGLERTFATVERLSAFLLAPILVDV